MWIVILFLFLVFVIIILAVGIICAMLGEANKPLDDYKRDDCIGEFDDLNGI